VNTLFYTALTGVAQRHSAKLMIASEIPQADRLGQFTQIA
jgi:hypothetical protein